MPTRPYVDLVVLAEQLRDLGQCDYGELVEWSCSAFACKPRSAKDAIAVLVRGGWVEARHVDSDRRRRSYALTPGGHEDLGTRLGRAAIRASRRRFSTCSRRARRARTYQARNGLEVVAQAIWLGQQLRYRAHAKLVQPERDLVPV